MYDRILFSVLKLSSEETSLPDFKSNSEKSIRSFEFDLYICAKLQKLLSVIFDDNIVASV